jgi:hypothetical protein
MLSMILGFGLLMGVYVDRDARLGSERLGPIGRRAKRILVARLTGAA